MDKVFVFGGTGFIGSALCRKLVMSGCNVYSVDSGQIKPENNLPDRVTPFSVDINKPLVLRQLIKKYKPEIIYWFAAKQGYGPYYSKFGSTNVNSIYSLFESIDASKYLPKRVILAGSQAVYTPEKQVTENWSKKPFSVYGFSKLQQEQAMSWFCLERGIPLITLRYSIVLGQGQALQVSESGMLRNWYRAFKSNKAPEIFGDGYQVRDFVHIDDVTEANYLSLCAKPGAYNVGGIDQSVLGMCGIFRSISGCAEPKILRKSVRPGGEYSLTSNSHKLEDETCWVRKRGLTEQVKDFYDFAESKCKSTSLAK